MCVSGLGSGRAAPVGMRSTSTTSALFVAKYVSFRSAGVPRSSAAEIALSHAWVSAIASSSRSIKLKPSWPPSVVATRLATGMNADTAGIFSSARLRFAMRVRLFLQVGRPLHLARGGRLELFTLALGRGDAVLDRLADRVIGVRDHGPRPLRRLARPLHGLAAAQLDRLAAQAFDLLPAGAGRDVRADCRTDESAEDEPAETTAAVPFVSHRDRKSTRLNSSHANISYAVFCLKKK